MTTINDFEEDGFFQSWQPKFKWLRFDAIERAKVNLDALNNVVKQLNQRLTLLEERRPRGAVSRSAIPPTTESKQGGKRKKRRRRTKRKRTKRKRTKRKRRKKKIT